LWADIPFDIVSFSKIFTGNSEFIDINLFLIKKIREFILTSTTEIIEIK